MTWNLTIENIAGIRRGEARIDPGVNAVRATNWQGKSSFLRAIETAMGTERSLTEGEDTGSVELETPEGVRQITLHRRNNAVIQDGEPYLDDGYRVVCADLYAFLSDDNEVREAVRQGRNLEDVLTRPLDFEDIDQQVRELKEEREQVERELERAREAVAELNRVEDRIEELTERREDVVDTRDQLSESAGDDVDVRNQLSEARAERDRLQSRIDRLERSIERTREKLAERREEHEALEVPEDEELVAELETARDRLERIERDENLLRSVYAANKRVLDEDRVELVSDVDHNLLEDLVTCWVCGDEAEREVFEERISVLGDRVSELVDEAETYRERVHELEERRDRMRRKRREKTDLEDDIADLESTLEDRTDTLDTVREQLRTQEERIEDLADEIEETDDDLAEVEAELKYVDAELSDLREEREELSQRAAQIESLQAERQDITDDIERLRNRKDEMKRRTRESFDDAINDMLDLFEVSFESARLTPSFDLVVARDGREVSRDALSEGELELLGIVAALAGFEAFDVAEDVPVLLIDRLGGLSDANLHALVEYLQGRAEYLVFTAYPEHEAFDGHEIDPQEWTVVADDAEQAART